MCKFCKEVEFILYSRHSRNHILPLRVHDAFDVKGSFDGINSEHVPLSWPTIPRTTSGGNVSGWLPYNILSANMPFECENMGYTNVCTIFGTTIAILTELEALTWKKSSSAEQRWTCIQEFATMTKTACHWFSYSTIHKPFGHTHSW